MKSLNYYVETETYYRGKYYRAIAGENGEKETEIGRDLGQRRRTAGRALRTDLFLRGDGFMVANGA